MSSNYLGGGLLVLCKLPELLIPEGFIGALKALEDAARSMTAWIQFVVPPINGVHERPNQTMDVPLSLDTFTNRVLDVMPAESSSRVPCLSGRSAGKKVSKSDVKAAHSQVRWPLEPADQFIADKIYKLLKKALRASDAWEAMEYLMAARGLFRDWAFKKEK